jgi:NAD(P)-dependent dehydrogenase (short-subunit alcohol dehydrogenase family)
LRRRARGRLRRPRPQQVEAAVAAAVEHLGGLDIVIANAGVAAQLPLVEGDPAIFERTIEVNLLGVYYTLRAAGPHIAHERGYALAIASLGRRAPAVARRLQRRQGGRRGAWATRCVSSLPRAARGLAWPISESSTPT